VKRGTYQSRNTTGSFQINDNCKYGLLRAVLPTYPGGDLMLSEQKAREDYQCMVSIFNTRDTNRIASWFDEHCTPNCIYNNPSVGNPVIGRESFMELVRGIYNMMPDLYQNAFDDLIVQGDKVAYRYSVNRADPTSGKRQVCICLAIYHYSGDKIKEMWELVGPWQDEA